MNLLSSLGSCELGEDFFIGSLGMQKTRDRRAGREVTLILSATNQRNGCK